MAAGVGSVLAANPRLLTQEIKITPGQTIPLHFKFGICVMVTSATYSTCAFSKQATTKEAKIEFIWNGNENHFKFNDETAVLINILKGDSGEVCLKNNASFDIEVSLCYLGF